MTETWPQAIPLVCALAAVFAAGGAIATLRWTLKAQEKLATKEGMENLSESVNDIRDRMREMSHKRIAQLEQTAVLLVARLESIDEKIAKLESNT